ncbi:MAG: vitamin B12-dependent ribonucleotide reductase [Patescibacteria group bacterium]
MEHALSGWSGNLPEKTPAKDNQRVVEAVVAQISGLSRVKKIRLPDGSTLDFSPAAVGSALAAVLKESGVNDEASLAQLTHQAVSRIDRQFGALEIPRSVDIDRIIATILIDNNLAYAAKRFLLAEMPVSKTAAGSGLGVRFRRRYTRLGTHPYDEIAWEQRDAIIKNDKGVSVFEQRGVEVPASWSQGATNIVASKYFRGKIGGADREWSVRQLVDRVVKTITEWGVTGGYFATEADAETFDAELTHLLVNQAAAFNSPVWFNVGAGPKPQCSACFINSVRDDMRSILNLTVTEGMLFKYGSGTGTNLSALRSSKEMLAHSNGKASGPVSFMKGYDAFAGVIKSGGKTRRAAKMVILNVDHPDIEDFITCKTREERKAKALIGAGYDGSIDGDAYASVFFQNANNSVRVTDDFMHACVEDGEWQTKAVTTGDTVETLKARELLGKMAKAAWECGDPGLQYDTTVNRWNPVANSGRINGSNPCSEYMFLDDSSCNLASLNLMKFRRPDGELDAEAVKHAVALIITAQEIIVDNAGYPTPAIEQKSTDFRALGIGYANLGALLMSRGLAYDSDEGRNYAAAVTSLMTGQAYYQSARLAEAQGPFAFFRFNEKPFLKVIGMHRDRAYASADAGVPDELVVESRHAWDNALEHGLGHGYRNAQVSLLAPTGTIGFMMDCDTTGIEPDIALVKYKWLVGGGLMKIVNQTVPEALTRLGYSDAERAAILDHLDKNDTIEGAPGLKEEHCRVFDCAFKPAKGKRFISYEGHIKMMAAVQPFLSGAISKTVNMPAEATPEDIEKVFIEAWKIGLKSIAVYRDGSKGQQVLTTSSGKEEKKEEAAAKPAERREAPVMASAAAPVAPIVSPEAGRGGHLPLRRRLPDERKSITHKFSVAGHEGYITVGLYDDGTPGEIFLRMAKGGSVISGLMDALALSTSIALQYGVPLRVMVNKFIHVRFEPSGFTTNPHIRIAKSLVDYMFRWLAMKFLPLEDQIAAGVHLDVQTIHEAGESDVRASSAAEAAADSAAAQAAAVPPPEQLNLSDIQPAARERRDPELADSSDALTAGFDNHSDAPACFTCGAMMVRNGACYKCLNCGSTSGCS